MKDILIIEPFCGGSHGQLVKVLCSDWEIGLRAEVCSFPAKKWHWRARTSALCLSQVIPHSRDFRVLFASSVLNVAELVALRPDLAGLKKILYFHENQLVYPVQKHQERDFQYGYNQILSCLVSDIVVFNSAFNMESFLSSISSFLKLIPDHRPKNLESLIRPKCQVLYFPMNLKTSNVDISTQKEPAAEEVSNTGHSSATNLRESRTIDTHSGSNLDVGDSYTKVVEETIPHKHLIQPQLFSRCHIKKKECLHIVWPHRWEHDKDPESFFSALFSLQEEGLEFYVSVVGETFSQIPDIFETARQRLGDSVLAWGYQSREDYFKVLDAAQVVVSTARHEFFGVSMLEAVSWSCYPLCPNRLVYPEIYPKECLYSTQAQLVKKLRRFCKRPQAIDTSACRDLSGRFLWSTLRQDYRKLILQ